MRPDDNQAGRQVGTPRESDQPYVQVPPPRVNQAQKDAAAQVIRSQIDQIYSQEQPSVIQAQPKPVTTQTKSPYARTMSDDHREEISKEQWKKYHSAWQQYYQQYYATYYSEQVSRVERKISQSLEAKETALQKQAKQQATRLQAAAEQHQASTKPAGMIASGSRPKKTTPISKNPELNQLKDKLLKTVNSSAKKVRRSRHFIPIISALAAVLIFVFLQYNSLIFATVKAYISPGNINPQDIVIDPTSSTPVGPDPKLIIPKINVDVPILFNIGLDHASQMKAMENGVAQFAIPGADALPGQVGNFVVAGHSSNDAFAVGDYKFIFAQLEKVNTGDTIYINYQSKRYTYTVTKTAVVAPNNVSALTEPVSKPTITLVTCTPVGTALNRLLVTAEQISPDPANAQKSTSKASSSTKATMPGTDPTLLEKLFGSNG